MIWKAELVDIPDDEFGDRLFERLHDLGNGDSVYVVTDREITPDLYRYQQEWDCELTWTIDRSDSATEPDDTDEAGAATYQIEKGPALAADEQPKIEVRELPPQRRHELLLDVFEGLSPDEGFELVNDHDPKPLYHEFRSLHGETFDWEYVDEGSDAWRVEVVKTEASSASDTDVVTRFDVRDIPKAERHPTIHHRWGMIPAGEAMEIVAPHEPRPLEQEFREQYGDSFAWEIVENDPGRCRVRITKAGDADAGTRDDESDAFSITTELDVRELPPARRHELIFEEFDELDVSEGFVLVNDHDPKPLYHQFEAEVGSAIHWEYRKRAAEEFRVLVGKAEPTDSRLATDGESEAPF